MEEDAYWHHPQNCWGRLTQTGGYKYCNCYNLLYLTASNSGVKMIILFLSIILKCFLVSGIKRTSVYYNLVNVQFKYYFIQFFKLVFKFGFASWQPQCSFFGLILSCFFPHRLLSQWQSPPETSWHLYKFHRYSRNLLFTQNRQLWSNPLVQAVKEQAATVPGTLVHKHGKCRDRSERVNNWECR